jgi:hypothetical protein
MFLDFNLLKIDFVWQECNKSITFEIFTIMYGLDTYWYIFSLKYYFWTFSGFNLGVFGKVIFRWGGFVLFDKNKKT